MSELPHQDVNLTPAEAALFYRVQFHARPVSDLPGACEECSGGRVATADCEAALAECLAKGWLQVIDGAALAAITNDVRAAGLIGPIYGLPKPGDVDFTPVGAAIWLSQCDPRDLSEPPFDYQIVVHAKSSHYVRTKAAAQAIINELQEWDHVDFISDPCEIGPWRTQWWRRFPAGYRIDTEWHGHGHDVALVNSVGFRSGPFFPQAQPELQRLQHILDCHDVTLAQWMLLAAMDSGSVTWTTRLPRIVADSAGERFGATVTEEQCRTGLQDCLRLGWLMTADFDPADPTRQTIARETLDRIGEIKALLREEPAIMPIAWTLPLRAIHFTPSGAALYRRLAAQWLGPAWEDEINVSQESYREEHRYYATQQAAQAALQNRACRREKVLASKIVPIGPWCGHWWMRFPRGYRLELQLGDPVQGGIVLDRGGVALC